MDESIIIANGITLLAGFGGAILGSWVSGRIAKNHAEEDKKSRQKTEYFKMMIKASLIQSDFTNLKREMDESIATANGQGFGDRPMWTKVQANPGEFEKINITPDDLVCLFEAREFGILSDLVEIGLKHSRLVAAFNTYSQLRSELKDHMPVHDVTGPIVGSNLTESDMLRLQPRFFELSSLLESIYQLLPRYLEESEKLSKSLGPAARKYFNDPQFPVLAKSSKAA